MMRSQLTRIFVLALLGVIAANQAQADLIPLINAGFEAPLFLDGELTGELTGWSTPFFLNNNPASAQVPGGVAEGENVSLSGGEVTRPIHASDLAQGDSTLQVDVDAHVDDRFPGSSIPLLAGDILLAEDDSRATPSGGTFLTSTINFGALASDLRLGTALEIRPQAKGSAVDFDNVRLSFTPSATVPEPASATMPAVRILGLAALSRRCRREHLA